MTIRLEHANLSVRDLDGVAQFLKTAFPEFKVRGQGESGDRRWLHMGTEDTYIALTEASDLSGPARTPYSGSPGFNHLGYQVDDAEALRRRMIKAGYRDSTIANTHPHRQRVYFHDPDGNDWEFVQYFSDDPAERNDYSDLAVG